MSIKVTDLAQSDLLEDLNIADSSTVIGGSYGGYFPRRPSFNFLPGTATGGSIANLSASHGSFSGTAIGFGAASGYGFTAASSNASVSGANGGSANANGGGFTGGNSGIINGSFDRV